MKYKLQLFSLSSIDVDLETWEPDSMDDIFISLDIEVGYSDGSPGTNMFYATLASEEGLRFKNIDNAAGMKIIPCNNDSYDFALIKNEIIRLLDHCSKNSWDESCKELSKHLSWEYEDYQPE